MFCTVGTIVIHKTITVGSTVTLFPKTALRTTIEARYIHVVFHHNSRNLQVRARRYRRRLGLNKRQRNCLKSVCMVDWECLAGPYRQFSAGKASSVPLIMWNYNQSAPTWYMELHMASRLSPYSVILTIAATLGPYPMSFQASSGTTHLIKTPKIKNFRGEVYSGSVVTP